MDPDTGGHPELTRAQFADAYASAFGHLCRVASAEVGSAASEDVVQRAAMVCLERLGTFHAGTDIVAWMAAVVRGVARNERRSIKRRARRERNAAAPDESNQANPLDRLADDAEIFTDIRNALDLLEPLQRSCIVLKAGLGHSYAEVGSILGIPEVTARSHAHRARRKLAETLRRQGSGDD